MIHSCLAKRDQRAMTRLWSKSKGAKIRWRNIMIETIGKSRRRSMIREKKCSKPLRKSIIALVWYRSTRIKRWSTNNLTWRIRHWKRQELVSIWMHLLLRLLLWASITEGRQQLLIQVECNWITKRPMLPYRTREHPSRIANIFRQRTSQRNTITMSIYLLIISRSSQVAIEIPEMAETGTHQTSPKRSN